MLHPDDMFCEQCGSTLKEIGYLKVRDELEYIPAKVKIIRYMQQAVNVLRANTKENLLSEKLIRQSLC